MPLTIANDWNGPTLTMVMMIMILAASSITRSALGFQSFSLVSRTYPCLRGATTSTSRNFCRGTTNPWREQKQQPSTRFYSSLENDHDDDHRSSLAIVGGGLAGLATCHFWLDAIAAELTSKESLSQEENKNKSYYYKIDIYDVEDQPGVGGASAVAGGLVHPLSPRGKLVYQGLEGLKMSNQLIEAATQATSSETPIVLSDCIWRCANLPKQVKQLQKTAQDLPELCQWFEGKDLEEVFPMNDALLSAAECKNEDANTEQTTLLGALRMSQGCRVVHVPSYLQGLWQSCNKKADEVNESLSQNEDNPSGVYVDIEWKPIQNENLLGPELQEYGTVVLSSGASIFQKYLKRSNDAADDSSDNSKHQEHVFPVQLVRGQSIEFTSVADSSLPNDNAIGNAIGNAFLCGKYISPLPFVKDKDTKEPRGRVLVGATHEFKADATPHEQVEHDLKCATEFMVPRLWDERRYIKDGFTEGYRVQSQRGKYGRLPLVGKLDASAKNGLLEKDILDHENLWIYTGLSSRGILYHALFAQRLVDAAWNDDEASMIEKYPELTWWKS